MLTAALISTSISCGEVRFSAERRHWSMTAASAPTLPASCRRLMEFSFHSFAEFRREKLQSNDTGAPDDFLRHAGDHINSQLRQRSRDRLHAASNAETLSDLLALKA